MSHDGHFVHIVLVLCALACLLVLVAPAGREEQRRRALRRAAGSGRLVSDAERRALRALTARPEAPQQAVTTALAATVVAAGLHAVLVPEILGADTVTGTVLAGLAAAQILLAVATVRRAAVPVLAALAAVDGAGLVGDLGGGLRTAYALAPTGTLWAVLPWVAECAAVLAVAVGVAAIACRHVPVREAA